MSGSAIRHAALSAAFSACALFTAPALAQNYDGDIAVNPPVVQRETSRHSYADVPSRRPVGELSVTRAVRTDDLRLDTQSGADELERRIHASAVASCRQIDAATADTLIDNEFTCVRNATREARLQIDGAARG